MRRRHLILAVTLALVAVLLLAVVPSAFAAAGGGTGGFGGGGGGGDGGGGGGGGKAFALYIVLRLLIDIALLGHGKGALVLLVLALAYAFVRFVIPKFTAAAQARRQRGGAHRRDTRRRARRVELAAAEAADEDPMFDPETVRAAAGALFTQIQFAWDAGDRVRLRGLVAPRLLGEWERRLDDFDRKGWRNRVEPLEEPAVEYVGLSRGNGNGSGNGNDAGAGDTDNTGDRVVVRIEARMRDYVTDAQGRRIKRRSQFTETVRLREFWTLQRRGNHWILASIEQGAEGSHALDATLAPTAWSNTQALTDEAVLEQAAADAGPAGVSPSELVGVGFKADARAAALDLSLVDGRFAPLVLEAAARRAVDAWAEAVDGSTEALRRLAEPAAIRDLLHPGDPSERTRVVVRGTELQRIEIVALEPTANPPAMTIDVLIRGHRYIEDRDTTQVLAGDPARATTFTERWTLAVTGDAADPWRIVSVQTPTRTV